MKKKIAFILGSALCVVLGVVILTYAFRPDPATILLLEVKKTIHAELISEKIRYIAAYDGTSAETWDWSNVKEVLLGKYEHKGRIPVEIRLGFDLDKLTNASVVELARGQYEVRLPPIKILDVKIDILSPECEIEVLGPVTRRAWDKLTDAPRAMDTVRAMLASTVGEELLIKGIESSIQQDGERFGEHAKQVLSSIFSNASYSVAFITPQTSVDELVNNYLEEVRSR